MRTGKNFIVGIIWLLACGAPSPAAVPADVGLAAFRTVSTNLDGSGIRVAQIEASLTADRLTWEVNPASVPQTAGSYTFNTFNGSTNFYPNLIGAESPHADLVGHMFYGNPGGLATNASPVEVFEADYFYDNYLTAADLPGLGDPVVNQSFTFGPLSPADQATVDAEYDDYASQNQTLFVSAANNLASSAVVCAPGTAYNCLSVGAYANGTYVNSIGPTPDNGRCKPDLTAPGSETSFSTPIVAGAAADLLQAALRGDGGSDTNDAADFRTLKALLLNGAVKPPDWTNGPASPLDARYGSGVINLLNSYKQLTGGRHPRISTTIALSGNPTPPDDTPGEINALSGWDFATNFSGTTCDTVNHYYFAPGTGAPGSPWAATATLVWNRQFSQSDINHLRLYLYACTTTNLVACSTSFVDNVQHLYVPRLPAGRYDLQVWKAGGLPGTNIISAAEPYALAWAFVSPTLSLARSAYTTTLTWPLYPDGLVVETATNWLAPLWTTNCLPPPVITNGLNCLTLCSSNVMQIFRLSSR